MGGKGTHTIRMEFRLRANMLSLAFPRFSLFGIRVHSLHKVGVRTFPSLPSARPSSILVSSASLRAHPGLHSIVLGMPSDIEYR
jgi:hypothetical protein